MIASILIIAVFFSLLPALFPFVIILLSHFFKQQYPLISNPSKETEQLPFVSILIPVHNKALQLKEKLTDISDSDYPSSRIEIIVLLDGEVKGAKEAAADYRAAEPDGPELNIIQLPRAGKNRALSSGAQKAKGSLLLFTDADARIKQSAITRLVETLKNHETGGACGRHMLTSESTAQKAYWDMEAKIKSSEMKIFGSVTASYGTFIGIKKHLFLPIPDGVTDDHYITLSVAARGLKFAYSPEAIVYIEKPSKNLVAEITRKRRITSQSFYSLKAWKTLLNPFKNGWYSICLWCHKVLRRLFPVFAIIIFIFSLLLSFHGNTAVIIFLVLQSCFYFISICALIMGIRKQKLFKPLRLAAFFLAANIGMLLGVIDFIRGKKAVIW